MPSSDTNHGHDEVVISDDGGRKRVSVGRLGKRGERNGAVVGCKERRMGPLPEGTSRESGGGSYLSKVSMSSGTSSR